jgi:hypothetical protein
MNIIYKKLTLVSILLFAITTVKTYGQVLPDLSSVRSVMKVPALSFGKPKAGARVKQTTQGWENTNVYHVLYLPRDWKPGKKYPVIVEFAGNGNYRNKYGDVSNGSVEGSSLGYGLSKGKEFIWICMPFIDVKASSKVNAITWWGDVEETKKYIYTTLDMLGKTYGADLSCTVLAGFSRGSIACNYMGLNDDQIAQVWKAFFCHSHYDGVNEKWPYPFADRKSALQRLQRLKEKPQWISQEGSTKSIREYLDSTGIKGDFTFQDIPYRNHSDTWLLKNTAESKAARLWLRKVVRLAPLTLPQPQSKNK